MSYKLIQICQGRSICFLLVSNGTATERTATLTLLFLSLCFLCRPSHFWHPPSEPTETFGTHTRVWVCLSALRTPIEALQCFTAMCVHSKFDKWRLCSSSNCNELVAFIIFFSTSFSYLVSPFVADFSVLLASRMVIVSILFWSQFIWFCLLSLLTNYCLRGKKCFKPLSQSDLFRSCSCSFNQVLSFLLLLTSSFPQIYCSRLWVIMNVITVVCGRRTGSNSWQASTSKHW